MGNKGSVYRRGTLAEQKEKKSSGRQCVWGSPDTEVDEAQGREKVRCKNKTGRNRFFCPYHLKIVNDYGITGA